MNCKCDRVQLQFMLLESAVELLKSSVDVAARVRERCVLIWALGSQWGSENVGELDARLMVCQCLAF